MSPSYLKCNSNIASEIYTILWRIDNGVEWDEVTGKKVNKYIEKRCDEFDAFRQCGGEIQHDDPSWYMVDLYPDHNNTDFFVKFCEWMEMIQWMKSKSNEGKSKSIHFLDFLLANIEIKAQEYEKEVISRLRSPEQYKIQMAGGFDEIPF